jgi:hypothetical protein
MVLVDLEEMVVLAVLEIQAGAVAHQVNQALPLLAGQLPEAADK